MLNDVDRLVLSLFISIQGKYSSADIVQEPIHAHQEVLAGHGRAPDDPPMMRGDEVKLQDLVEEKRENVKDWIAVNGGLKKKKYLFDFIGGEGAGQILFVGKDEQGGAEKAFFLEELMELFFAILESPFVGRVHDPDETVRRLEIVSPIRAERFLASHIPNVQVKTAATSNGKDHLITEVYMGLFTVPKKVFYFLLNENKRHSFCPGVAIKEK